MRSTGKATRQDEFYDDLFSVTSFRTDPQLVGAADHEEPRDDGMGARPRCEIRSELSPPIRGGCGKRKFFGRMPLWMHGGGPGLVQSLTDTAEKKGVRIFYETRAVSLIYDGERVLGVNAKSRASSKFQGASRDARVRRFRGEPRVAHALSRPGLGAGEGAWHAFQRRRRAAHGARHRRAPYGNWSGRHAVSWERYAPEFGDLSIPESSYRHSFPLSLMINAEGKRFVDEGTEFYNYTYAKYGGEVLRQPQQFAYQVSMRKRIHCSGPNTTTSSDESRREHAGRARAEMEGVNPKVSEDDARIQRSGKNDVPFNHAVKDASALSESIRRNRTGPMRSIRRPTKLTR